MADPADGVGAAIALARPAQQHPPVQRVPVFTTVAMALLMMSVDSTIVATALKSMQHGLGASINWVGWTITAYSVGFVVMLPISGKLSERYGRRRVFLGSVVAFTAASLLCGLAENIYMLITLRALQAAGGAGFTPSATGIVVDYFGDARDRAVSLFGSIFPIGAMIGPIFGGLFVTYWNWRGVFFVNVPIGLVIIVLALHWIPRDPPRARKPREQMDVTGMVLLSVGLLAGMLAASYLGEDNARAWSPAFIVPALVATVAIRSFFGHVERTPAPFIAPRLLRGPGFGMVNVVNTTYSGITIGAVTLIPLYAANRYGIDALGAGALLTLESAAAMVFSVAGALALRRTGHRLPLYVGGVVMVVGMLLLAVRPIAGVTVYAWLAGAALLIGAGVGAVNPASRNAGLQLAPERSSTLAAVRTGSLQVGSIAIVSIVTAVVAGADDPGRAQAWVYVTVALLFAAILPFIRRVPEHRGSW